MMNSKLLFLSILPLLLMGCSAHQYRLGQSVAQMKAEQTYNPNAAQENQGYIPDGQGERVESALGIYTGKADESLKGTSSQVLNNF